MLDDAGPLQRAILSQTLWVAVALPIAGLVAHATLARTPHRARRVGLASTSLAALVTLAHSAQALLGAGGPRVLLEPLAGGARVGGLEIAFVLMFDPLSAVAACLACAVALAATVRLRALPPSQHDWRAWAWTDLALAGALLSFMAGGFASLALGWTFAAAAGACLAGWSDARAGGIDATRRAAGIVALLAAACLLYWGLGGDWEGDDYSRDRQVQLAIVRPGSVADDDVAAFDEPADPGAHGALTLASEPGAVVFLDESRTALARAPFVGAAVPAGAHMLRVRLPEAEDEAVVGPVSFAGGETVALVPLGPTLSFYDLAEQIGVRDRYGEEPIRRALQQRAGFGAGRLLTIVTLLLVGAAIVASLPPRAPAAPRVLVATAGEVTTTLLGPSLLARLAFLLPGTRRPAVAAFAVAALAAVGLAALRLRRPEEPRPPEIPGRRLVELAPVRAGHHLLAFEQWVIDAVGGSARGMTALSGWIASRSDAHLLGAPADAVARRVVRAGRRAGGLLGVPLSRLAWLLLLLAAVAAVALALRSGR
jgi:hypothetical protein